MHQSTLQGVDAELRHMVLREGWSHSVVDGIFVVVGPAGSDFVHEVWRISEYVAYDRYACIEKIGERPLEYRLSSKGSDDLYFVIVFHALDSEGE